MLELCSWIPFKLYKRLITSRSANFRPHSTPVNTHKIAVILKWERNKKTHTYRSLHARSTMITNFMTIGNGVWPTQVTDFLKPSRHWRKGCEWSSELLFHKLNGLIWAEIHITLKQCFVIWWKYYKKYFNIKNSTSKNVYCIEVWILVKFCLVIIMKVKFLM